MCILLPTPLFIIEATNNDSMKIQAVSAKIIKITPFYPIVPRRAIFKFFTLHAVFGSRRTTIRGREIVVFSTVVDIKLL